jgi:uncharacterized membrane protein
MGQPRAARDSRALPWHLIAKTQEQKRQASSHAFVPTMMKTERDGMPNSVDRFEMRRLEDLSNTIFGVAMTLLAYRFPAGQFLDGAPVWATIWSTYKSQIVALLLSFAVAGIFWISHQRRLAYEPLATRPVVYFNLLFLLSIIALPITTGLYGTYGNARDIVMLYSCHLGLISGLNAVLWLLACLRRNQPYRVIAPMFASGIFFVAAFIAAVAPQTHIVPFLWCGAFAAPVIEAIMARRGRESDGTNRQ